MPDTATEERLLLDPAGIAAAVDRLAAEILAQRGSKPLVLVGVYTRGLTLANRIASILAAQGITCPVGAIDVSLYRDDLDDLGGTPRLESTEFPVSVDGAHVVLCDEVLFTGRTVRAAMDGIMDYGRPAKIALAVLVDRGHRELPIQPDHAGLRLETTRDQHVQVFFREDDDGREGVFLRP